MLFVLIDSFLDRFSPIAPDGNGKAEDMEPRQFSGLSHHRLMDCYFDTACSRRPKHSAGEVRC